MHLQRSSIIAAIVVLAPAMTFAQQQVDTQVGQVDTRVNGELYGNNGQPPRQLGYQIQVLPSEERFAIERSGALPSEVQLAREAYGPLTPNGVIDYLPRLSPLQQASRLPSPQLFNPAYNPNLAAARQAAPQLPGPRRGFPQTLKQGLRATNSLSQSPQPAPQRIVPSLTPAPYRPLPTGPLYDQVRYNPNSTPGATILSRPPTTQPSLSEQQPKAPTSQPTTR
jgi:hypothetical protein